MSTQRKHILHQLKVNLFGLRDKVKQMRKPRKATRARK